VAAATPETPAAEKLSGSGGIGRHTILRGWRRKAWGFKSPLPHHKLGTVGILHYKGFLIHDHTGYAGTCFRLFLSDRRRPLAEWQKRRHRRRIWRTRQPNCFRPARRSNRTHQGDYLVRSDLHAHFHHAFDCGFSQEWTEVGAAKYLYVIGTFEAGESSTEKVMLAEGVRTLSLLALRI
jgi:hypothetical protein